MQFNSTIKNRATQNGVEERGRLSSLQGFCSFLMLFYVLFGIQVAFLWICGLDIGAHWRETPRSHRTAFTKWESISDIYSTYNQTPGLDHWAVYGPAYDENIEHLRGLACREGRSVQMLEIGVKSGGSTRVWKRYFRGLTQYVGLDINPRCRMFQSLEEGIRIITGSQLDKRLLYKICKEYGPFDLVVDDGGHTDDMIRTSLKMLWNCMKDNSVYVIEDLHTVNMKGYLNRAKTSFFDEIAMWMTVRSPSLGKKGQYRLIKHPSKHLKKLAFYDSIVFLHYANKVPPLFKSRLEKGLQWVRGKLAEPKKELSLRNWCHNCCIGCYDD